MIDIGSSRSGLRSSPPSIVEISSSDIARRRLANWGAIQADMVRVIRRETFEYRFSGPQTSIDRLQCAERHDGETHIEGLPTGANSAPSSASCPPDIGSTDGRYRGC